MPIFTSDRIQLVDLKQVHYDIIELLVKKNLCFEEAVNVLQDTQVALGKIKIQSLDSVLLDSQQERL